MPIDPERLTALRLAGVDEIVAALADKATNNQVAAVVTALASKATSADVATIVTALASVATRSDISDLATTLLPKATSDDIATVVDAITALAASTQAVSGSVDIGNLPATYPNQHAQPATDAQLRASPLPVVDARTSGTWGYATGADGSETITGHVLSLTAVAGTLAASLSINGGPAIAIPSNRTLTLTPRGTLVNPTLVFSGTQAYVVEWVAP